MNNKATVEDVVSHGSQSKLLQLKSKIILEDQGSIEAALDHHSRSGYSGNIRSYTNSFECKTSNVSTAAGTLQFAQ